MSRATAKSAIAEALRLLSRDHLQKFCFFLHDRREDPRVTRTDLGDGSVETISDMLVSKFSAAGAVGVTMDLLRSLTYNSAADVLESRTKALIDEGVPTFRRTSAGELDVGPSQEALRRRIPMRNSLIPAKTAQEVEAEAMECVRSEGGSPDGDSTALVLSRYTLQFGQYRGQTFKWLLENDLQYSAYIITGHESEEPRHQRQTPDPLMDNKDSLRKYAIAHRAFRKVRSLELAQNGKALVGFGKYKDVKLRELYQDPDRRRYLKEK
ncbi:uncharacterized protein LOC142899569 [Nelusetta ayraudi]|uniref:uncharacterized protein LOC142899569 n=1 Tax=Nelusetta ayraudi TaxID=303726 RepID=UPI003F70E187